MTRAMLAERPAELPKGAQERVLVTLTVADQLCGVAVDGVRDVLGEQSITRIPLAPPEIAGSLNLRGRIVTVLDLRRRLGLPPAPPGTRRMSVVTELGGELYALLVDQVSEVLSLPAEQFERNPSTLPAGWANHSTGIYRLTGRLLVVLDVKALIGTCEGVPSPADPEMSAKSAGEAAPADRVPAAAPSPSAVQPTGAQPEPAREVAAPPGNDLTRILADELGEFAFLWRDTVVEGETELDALRNALRDIGQMISTTRVEIARLNASGHPSLQADSTSGQLNAVVAATERAAEQIMSGAEEVQDAVLRIRTDPRLSPAVQSHLERIEASSTDILTACSFQDLTGQRIRKVMQALSYVEARVSTLDSLWNCSNVEVPAETPDDQRPDAHLISGPSETGLGQADIDSLFG